MAKAKRKAAKAGSRSAVGKRSGELDQIEAIFELMNRHGVAEIDWENDGTRLHVRTEAAFAGGGVVMAAPAAAPRAVAAAPASVAASVEAPAPALKGGGLAANQKQVLSPFVGTFYRSPSPTADPYAREGQSVKRGDVLCIIEAMKLMNEIESEFDGRIVQIVAENGQPVEFGEPLFIIET